MMALFLIGLVLRIVTLLLFFVRSNFTLVSWTQGTRYNVLRFASSCCQLVRRLCCCLRSRRKEAERLDKDSSTRVRAVRDTSPRKSRSQPTPDEAGVRSSVAVDDAQGPDRERPTPFGRISLRRQTSKVDRRPCSDANTVDKRRSNASNAGDGSTGASQSRSCLVGEDIRIEESPNATSPPRGPQPQPDSGDQGTRLPARLSPGGEGAPEGTGCRRHSTSVSELGVLPMQDRMRAMSVGEIGGIAPRRRHSQIVSSAL